MASKSVRSGSAAAVLLLAAGLLWAGACESEGGTEPPPREETATIQVSVRVDGSARQGVTVRLFEPNSSSALATEQTAANGVATFPDLSPGTYEAEVAVPAGLDLAEGETARKSVTVAAGATASVVIDLVMEEVDVVEIRLTSGNRFDPSSVTISPGTRVRWVNDIDRYHTITPDGHSEWSRVEIDNADEVFTHTFNNTGEFDYFCEPHQSEGMIGTITVQ